MSIYTSTHFTKNKYTKWYYNIITSSINRKLDESVYTEKHHIIPKCLGGSNKKDNIAVLTAREHFICHWLLTKMTTGTYKAKMYTALIRLQSSKNCSHKITSSQYEIIKRKFSEAISGSGNSMYGKKHSPETLQKMRIKRLNNPPPQHVIDNLQKAHKNANINHAVNIGKHWYNDGFKSYLQYECPPGCVPGRL